MANLRDDSLNIDLCKALGLNPDDVYSLKMVASVDSITHIEVGKYVNHDELGRLSKVLEKYELILKETTEGETV